MLRVTGRRKSTCWKLAIVVVVIDNNNNNSNSSSRGGGSSCRSSGGGGDAGGGGEEDYPPVGKFTKDIIYSREFLGGVWIESISLRSSLVVLRISV